MNVNGKFLVGKYPERMVCLRTLFFSSTTLFFFFFNPVERKRRMAVDAYKLPPPVKHRQRTKAKITV